MKQVSDDQPNLKFIDLFAGIGGLRSAFEQAGGSCVFSSEWDRFSQQTYRANFTENREIFGDITKVAVSDIPDHDILVGGFPCQPFSLAGVSKKNSLGRKHGFLDETQGTLFFDILRILKKHRPAAFLLENVKNLRSHDNGRTFEVILNSLTNDLDYKVKFKIVDAAHFLPQSRQRIVLVGFREHNDFCFSNVVLPPKGKITLSSILHPEDGSEPPESHYTEGPLAKVSEKYTLSDKLWDYLQRYAEKHKAKGNGFGYGLVGPDDVSRTLSARYYKDGSEILVRREKGGNPRRLTPRECARLMGFNDTFKIPVSDTQAYKQFGNSVAIPAFTPIASELLRALKAR